MSTEVSDPLIGVVLDRRYLIQERLAQGGMATVYLALDQRLDRDVALKVLHPHLAHDPDFVARFQREARSAARLAHPNIVAVHDQGDDQGHLFLVMEYVAGQTLRQILDREGAMSPRAATDIMGPVLKALGTAHTAGFIHRDVKPENIILREDGVVKVADFGLARTVSSQTATSATGVLLGTAAYLSPEQVERGIADPRSDVYATGLVLFEMLTGTKAMAGDNPIHVAYSHVHKGVPATSERAEGVPEVLEALVAEATSKDPDERPANGNEMAAKLAAARRELAAEELDARSAPLGAPASSSAATATMATPAPAPKPEPSASGAATTALPLPAAASTGAQTTQQLPTLPGSSAQSAMTVPVATRRRRPIWPWIAVFLAACVTAATAWFFLAGPGAPTRVPAVDGAPIATARAALVAAHLDAKEVLAYSETVPKGIVISANPGPGTQLTRGREITLTVSRGPERYAVPTVTGSALTAARTAITGAHLSVGKVTEVFDEKAPQGTVISTTPKAGSSQKPNTPIAIVVSKGREPITIVDWTGKSAAEAKKTMTDAGLVVDDATQEFNDTVPTGAVIRQSPNSGTLFKGDKVTIVVSKGPQLVDVPNVVGQQVGPATDALKAAGFQVTAQQLLPGVNFGTVQSMSPSAGTKVPPGTMITLYTV